MRSGFLAASLALTASAVTGETYYAGGGGIGGSPIVGIEMSPVPLDVQGREGIGNNQGVYVRQVYPDTAAARMGIQPGDVILGLNGSSIDSMTSLRNTVSGQRVGDSAQVTVTRGGRQVDMTGAFGEWPASIPFTPIDPEAERQYREWQAQRMERSRDEIERVREEIDQVRRNLSGDRDGDGIPDAVTDPAVAAAAAGPSMAVRQAMSYLALLPAWHLGLRFEIDDRKVRNFPVPPLRTYDVLPAKAADEPAWCVHFTSGPIPD